MDWILLTELSSMFAGPWHAAELSAVPNVVADADASTDAGADASADTGSALTAADVWIAQQAYAFIAKRTVCERCGARLSRKVCVAVSPDGAKRIGVAARCRGWRRHPYTALVGRSRDGLRFGTLEPS
ncbi:hypothetical protein Caci_4235 [Catenulispora acidiphila DSM 44928]|uniref:Uncharacterized protein n=1 Tax=Catenulispora acidiphila (strain DSM 44928 / JCM 14897 / NBRC 102108 / NRRL B-24433 / ID139908) TaxID=479433 RepID=C7QI54_CATAD|nr:hypothetical protein [Catenulispora acidiphila]ACU73099.1 hypothetical protein Caci_4235 [Catenulispora acidiphila DSM 44928]